MSNKTLPLSELSIAELYNSSKKSIFEVPIYQRNYAWEKEEITTLIQDVYDAYKKGSDVYFIGTLVTFVKDDNVYEVIDGQQRLTTINLVLNALGIKPNNPLTYKARKKSNNTIKNIPDFNIEERDNGIINGYNYAKTAIKEIIEEGCVEEFRSYFLDYVHIIRYDVPKDIDLNHYFEIMNSRGEQLEKHEIIKARLIGMLENDHDKSIFNNIWECCSEMGVYIQQKYNDSYVFGENICEFSIGSFEEIIFEQKNNEKTISINELIENETSTEFNNPNLKDERPDSFQPIIDFPNFLLTVLKVTRIINESDFNPLLFNLDDKELINEFEQLDFSKYGGESNFSKIFAYNLLKAKYLLDNYIVHHSNEDDSIDNNPWKLQYWHKDKRHGLLKNLSEDIDSQQNLLQLLSMFEVSFTPRQRKNYLFYCLLFLFDNYTTETYDEEILPKYEKFLEDLAEKYLCDVYMIHEKLNNINVPKPGSFDEAILVNNRLYLSSKGVNRDEFERIYGNGNVASKGVPLFVFNYIDYKIWKYYAYTLRGEKTKEGSTERKQFFDKLGCGDFGLDIFNQFYFSRTRRSLEHYFPQANISDDIIDINQINCIGNYAMIGSDVNSSGSNWSPKTKLDHYLDSSGKIKQVSVASLKFMIMMQICKDNLGKKQNGNEWTFEDIKNHQNCMLDILLMTI